MRRNLLGIGATIGILLLIAFGSFLFEVYVTRKHWSETFIMRLFVEKERELEEVEQESPEYEKIYR